MSELATTGPDFTADEAAEAWVQYRAQRCTHCGGAHTRACPRVRRLEFHPNGQLAAVEFWPDGKWPTDGLLWPEDLPPEPGAA